jgi:hypothetical protein
VAVCVLANGRDRQSGQVRAGDFSAQAEIEPVVALAEPGIPEVWPKYVRLLPADQLTAEMHHYVDMPVGRIVIYCPSQDTVRHHPSNKSSNRHERYPPGPHCPMNGQNGLPGGTLTGALAGPQWPHRPRADPDMTIAEAGAARGSALE